MMSAALRPIAIRVGPLPSGSPAIEVVLADGRSVPIELDVGQASRLADRLRECIDGRVRQLPPSRRVTEIALGFNDEGPSSGVGIAVVPNLETGPETEGSFP